MHAVILAAPDAEGRVSSSVAFLIIACVLAGGVAFAVARVRPARPRERSVDDFRRAMRALAPRQRDER